MICETDSNRGFQEFSQVFKTVSEIVFPGVTACVKNDSAYPCMQMAMRSLEHHFIISAWEKAVWLIEVLMILYQSRLLKSA